MPNVSTLERAITAERTRAPRVAVRHIESAGRDPLFRGRRTLVRQRQLERARHMAWRNRRECDAAGPALRATRRPRLGADHDAGAHRSRAADNLRAHAAGYRYDERERGRRVRSPDDEQ